MITKYHMSLFLSLRKSFCLPPLSFHNIVAKFYSTSKIFCCKFFLLRALNLVVPKTVGRMMAPLLKVQWAAFFISTLYTYTASTKTQGHKSWAKDTGCAHPIHAITFHKVVVCTAAYHSDQWGSHLSDSVPGVPISRASATQRQFHLTVCDWLNIG